MLPLKDHNPTFTTPFVTYGLVVINTLVMLWLSTLSPLAEQQEFDDPRTGLFRPASRSSTTPT